MRTLEGRVGIVTGGSSGIGYAVANVLANAGAAVYVVSRTGNVKKGISPSVPGVIHVKGDIADREAMTALAGKIAGETGLDFLVNKCLSAVSALLSLAEEERV